MSLNFLNPMYLWGLLGLALPVVVHLLTRRQQTHIKFSAVYLLYQAQKRSIRRSRPNRLLLMLLRCLGVAFLCLALANPLFSFEGPEELLSGQPASNVFILDDSYSMAAQAKTGTLFEHAVQVLASMLEHLPEHHHYSLILASDPARVVQGWTQDREALKKKVKSLQASYRTTDIGGALELARDMTTSAPAGVKRVYLLTDLDENGWREEAFPALEGQPLQVRILDFSDLQAAPNQAAVEALDVSQEFLTNNRMVRIRTRVRNLSATRPLNPWNVSLWVNGKQQTEGFLNLPPGESVEHEFSFPHLGKEGLKGYVEVQPDGLAPDNRRLFAYQPDQRIRVLLVDGDPRGVSHQNEVFYIERAMNPFSAAVSDIEPVVATLAELPDHDLHRFSVLVLCNVRQLPFDYERELERFVAQGGALFLTLGDQVDAKYYNETLGGLLPVSLKSINQVDMEEGAFHLNTRPSSHPVLKIFSGTTLGEMNQTLFHTYFSLEPKRDRTFVVPMRLTNDAPLLVESDFKKGKVLLYATSIDRDWNNFPIQPTFLPWVQRWVKYAAQSLETITRRELRVGEPIELPAGEEQRLVETPGGQVFPLTAGPDTGPRFDQTDQPGVYSIYAASPPGTAPAPDTQNLPVRLPESARYLGGFTVNVDTAESAPGKISETRIRDLLRGLRVDISHNPGFWQAARAESGVSLATPFLLLVGLVLCAEGWLVRRE